MEDNTQVLWEKLVQYRQGIHDLCPMQCFPLTGSMPPHRTNGTTLINGIVPLYCQARSLFQAYLSNLPLSDRIPESTYVKLGRVASLGSNLDMALSTIMLQMGGDSGVDSQSVYEDAVDAEESTPKQELSTPAVEKPPAEIQNAPVKRPAPLPQPVVIEKREREPVPDTPAFGLAPAVEPTEFADLPKLVTKHINQWTGDQRRFSQNVVPAARKTPFSNAYMMGSALSEGTGLLDSGRREDSRVPNPATAFRLQWHRALLQQRLGELRLPTDKVEELTCLHNAQNLLDIAAIAEKNTNFKAQRERYSNLSALLTLLRDQGGS
eukprot:Protomagalhaensia_sp_Gyna_25__5241@NODE_639_length_2934_cov_218_730570_g498_i0_p2_GENE_NODE_639_length_2934_cov_218_730570_g498_i0NODE_639_length_2934_cov_218_730570_g498_i0_p2_ORF_typecomplete_len322_score31_14Med25_NRbox/PF11244_8/0_16_NODE_639_length_2934_cov_218_730570_g498_i018102775